MFAFVKLFYSFILKMSICFFKILKKNFKVDKIQIENNRYYLLNKIGILFNNVCEKIGERCRGELCSPAGERSSPLQIFAIILLAHIPISYNKFI